MHTSRIALSIVACLTFALSVRWTEGGNSNDSGIEMFVKELTSKDADASREAQQKLETLGADIVPVLFGKLPTADWELKPRLLEVLSGNGREFAKQMLLNGTETEKTYAALVYELTRAGERGDHDTPEFAAMVEVLLEAIKSDDKYLRAAAVLALVHDHESNVFFRYLHDLIPVLISSFDTDLIVRRRARGDPSDVVLVGICLRLDAFIGDRLAYLNIERTLWKGIQLSEQSGTGLQHSMRQFLTGNATILQELRKYWETWWQGHNKLRPVEIGRLAIERNIALWETAGTDNRFDNVVLYSFLKTWTGESFLDAAHARAWWKEENDHYTGPPEPGR